MLQVIDNSDEFNKLLKIHTYLLVDFFATWCGPCQRVSKPLEEFVRDNGHFRCVKIDVDNSDCREPISDYKIRSMPTFIFFVSGNEVARVSGADMSEIEKNVKKYFV